jgi:hypothetical protein
MVQTPISYRYHDLTTHDLSLEVGVTVIFPRAVVAVAADRLVRGQFLQPVLIVDQGPRSLSLI